MTDQYLFDLTIISHKTTLRLGVRYTMGSPGLLAQCTKNSLRVEP